MLGCVSCEGAGGEGREINIGGDQIQRNAEPRSGAKGGAGGENDSIW